MYKLNNNAYKLRSHGQIYLHCYVQLTIHVIKYIDTEHVPMSSNSKFVWVGSM